MAIFPQIGNEYVDTDNRDILARMEHDYTQAISINQYFWNEATIDYNFYIGDQQVWNQVYGNIGPRNRRNFNFNRIRRVIDMVDGYQRRNRKSTVVTPVENSDNETADQLSKVLFWAQNKDNTLDKVSDAFHGALISGMSLLHVWLDFRDDPVSGNINVDVCSYNSFLIDPFFKKTDLSDCNFVWKRSYVSTEEAVSLLPKYTDEILQLSGMGYTNDNKFEYMPQTQTKRENQQLTYDEYYYRAFRRQTMIIDTNTGETMEWPGTDEQLEEYLYTYPEVTKIEQEVPTVKLVITVQGKVLYHGPEPLGIDCYPFIPVFAYYHPEASFLVNRIQGMTRGLRDAQFLYNRRKVIELDILESQVNSGWKYKENSLVNPKDVFMSGQGKGLALKEDAQMTDVEAIQPAQIPPSMMELSQQLSQEIQEISGVNEELLGSADDEKAGILAQLRQGAGLTTLQRLFDQLDQSQKRLGNVMMRIIQTNFMPGKVRRIIDQEPAETFHNKAFGTYDTVIEEGVNTATQKQMQFIQLMKLRELGVNIPDETLIEAVSIENKTDLLKQLEEQKQQQQQEKEKQDQFAQQLQQAEIQKAAAEAKANTGLGYERLSRINENEALAKERTAQAFENTAQARENTAKAYESRKQAELDVLKSLREIDDLDLRNFEKLLSLTQALRQQEEQDTRQEVQEQIDRVQREQQQQQMQQRAQQAKAEMQQQPSDQPPSEADMQQQPESLDFESGQLGQSINEL